MLNFVGNRFRALKNTDKQLIVQVEKSLNAFCESSVIDYLFYDDQIAGNNLREQLK